MKRHTKQHGGEIKCGISLEGTPPGLDSGPLIAAIPELLDALKECVTYLDDACDFGMLDRHPAYAILNKARAALARAEGTA